MNLYQDNGYMNMNNIIDSGYPFIIVINGRGTGKTFNSLWEVLSRKIKFVYMRRTKTQVEEISTPGRDPFSDINKKKNTSYIQKAVTKNTVGIFDGEIVDGEIRPTGKCLGYICALSTFSTMRGLVDTDIDMLIFDEFIPEWNERPLREEYYTFLNAVETLSRNRELEGKPALQSVLLSNSNTYVNPILVGMKIVNKVKSMQENHIEMLEIKDRGILVIRPFSSPISEKKRDTALYKMAKNSDFIHMSIENRFSDFSRMRIKSMPIKEYTIIAAIGELGVYRHKSRLELYISTLNGGTNNIYGVSDVERQRFSHDFREISRLYLDGAIIFESQEVELLFVHYIQKKY